MTALVRSTSLACRGLLDFDLACLLNLARLPFFSSGSYPACLRLYSPGRMSGYAESNAESFHLLPMQSTAIGKSLATEAGCSPGVSPRLSQVHIVSFFAKPIEARLQGHWGVRTAPMKLLLQRSHDSLKSSDVCLLGGIVVGNLKLME